MWQPIESAPRDGTVIDLWGTDHTGEPQRFAKCRWDEDGEEWQQSYAEIESFAKFGDERYTLTHWMPLPQPPNG